MVPRTTGTLRQAQTHRSVYSWNVGYSLGPRLSRAEAKVTVFPWPPPKLAPFSIPRTSGSGAEAHHHLQFFTSSLMPKQTAGPVYFFPLSFPFPQPPPRGW